MVTCGEAASTKGTYPLTGQILTWHFSKKCSLSFFLSPFAGLIVNRPNFSCIDRKIPKNGVPVPYVRKRWCYCIRKSAVFGFPPVNSLLGRRSEEYSSLFFQNVSFPLFCARRAVESCGTWLVRLPQRYCRSATAARTYHWIPHSDSSRQDQKELDS